MSRSDKAMPLPVGTRVRFLVPNLGASTRDNLSRVVRETPAVGDEGIVAFPHARLPLWFFIAWSPDPSRTLYVGVTTHMVEVVP